MTRRRRTLFVIALGAALCAASAVTFAPSAHAAIQKPTPELVAQVQKAVQSSAGFKDRFAAQVWLMDMSGRLKPFMPHEKTRLRFLRLVHAAATQAQVPPELVLAVIQIESSFKRFALSVVGARGFMQVMPFWLDELNKPKANLFKTKINLTIGCTILHYYITKAHGDLRKALQSYNGALTSYTYSDKVLKALVTRWYRQ